MSTLTQLKTIAREYLQEASAKQFSDAQIGRYVQRAVKKLWQDLCLRVSGRSYLQTSSAISIVSGTQEYALPTEMLQFWGIKRIGITYPYWLKEIPMLEGDRYGTTSATSDYPRRFYLSVPYFGIVPSPSASIADALEVHYYKVHADLGDSEEPDFPSQWHELAAIRAAMTALRVDETSDDGLAREYLEMHGDMMLAHSQASAQPHTVRDTSDPIW